MNHQTVLFIRSRKMPEFLIMKMFLVWVVRIQINSDKMVTFLNFLSFRTFLASPLLILLHFTWCLHFWRIFYLAEASWYLFLNFIEKSKYWRNLSVKNCNDEFLKRVAKIWINTLMNYFQCGWFRDFLIFPKFQQWIHFPKRGVS